ncbi:Zinc finger A20 and AN1 domain-containing stress-associated protein 4 [Heracleum sosnowskyi]|uniref:Zinc finger A20 and AN1 domain-containing stress-associated protein 4 n=1 Tax=Heracleum sosnowskyi TaxID=360622 RepID=A0AAD8IPC8_9APIA|nr:Zinc finger A20 and AN1 domain-containing stress-associated protein 4 [Heracleum sosnowskyi]
MAEEHGFQAPEGHRLCANNCGFFGSPATQNFCSKCYRDISMKAEQEKSAKSAVENSLFPAHAPPMVFPTSSAVFSPENSDVDRRRIEEAATSTEAAAAVALKPNRCSSCRKRVGLMGFTCKCGVTFCGTHRYPEQHGCTFDFKAVGREAIARDNPLVKAQKLDKI